MRIEIRPPRKSGEYRYIEDIQRDAWRANDIDITPTHVCVATYLSGGCVYLAFDNGKPIGFVLGFLGLKNGKIFLHSHQLGVLRSYQNKNVGFLLKLKQREFAVRHGIDLIRWTFDPLQSKNAYFNFNKLGVICREYIIDLYGEIRDELNRGVPSDRFYVEWHIDSQRVISRLRGERPPRYEDLGDSISIINSIARKGRHPRIESVDLELNDDFLLVEIPHNYVEIKKTNPSLGVEWRLRTREIFTRYLENGYIVVDVISNKDKNRYFFVLSKKEQKTILSTNWWELL